MEVTVLWLPGWTTGFSDQSLSVPTLQTTESPGVMTRCWTRDLRVAFLISYFRVCCAVRVNGGFVRAYPVRQDHGAGRCCREST